MYLIDIPYISKFIFVQKDKNFNTLKEIPISNISKEDLKNSRYYKIKTFNDFEIPLPIINNKIIKIKDKLVCTNKLIKEIPRLKYFYISSSIKGKEENIFYLGTNNTIFINFSFDGIYDFNTYYNVFSIFKNEQNIILLSYFNIYKFTKNVLDGYIYFRFNSLHLTPGIYYIDFYINGVRYFSKDIEFKKLLYNIK
jgi:hypothetical protein